MRDCGVGSQEFLYQLLGGGAPTSLPSGEKMDKEQKSLEQNHQKHIGAGKKDVSTTDNDVGLTRQLTQEGSSAVTTSTKRMRSFLDVPSDHMSKIPDIMSPNPDTSQLISIADIKTSVDRLQLVGGAPGLLAHMQRDGVTPDIKSFTILLDVMRSGTRMEDMLVATMKDLNVVPDTGFFNMLMRKRVFRQHYAAARVSFISDWLLCSFDVMNGCQ
jgi:hypothetical protein